MRATKILMLACVIALSGILTYGCVDDIDDTALEAPGVIQEEDTYWVDDVMVTQRVTVIRSYDNNTYHFRGSVKNFGTTEVTNARFEIHSYDVITLRDGTTQRQDEEIGATQSMGNIPSQGELPINVSYTFSSFATRDIEGKFVAGSN